MRKNSKMILLSSAMAFSLTCNMQNFNASADAIQAETDNNLQTTIQESIEQNYLKVKFENKILFHKQIPTGTLLQVLDSNGDVIESEILEFEKELELNEPKIPKGKIFSYWAFEHKDNKLIIRPILIDSKSLNVSFYSSKGGEIIQNNAQAKEINISVDEGENLKDILPKVIPNAHFKFKGWFKSGEKVTNVEDVKILSDNDKYYAKFYQDYNSNNIDDATEKIEIKFVTNSKEKIENIETNVGSTINLPKLTKEGYIFMGWYTDKNFKTSFKNDPLTKSYTLYAKWSKAEEVIKKAETKPITNKDISDQIEKILNQRLSNYTDKSSKNSAAQKRSNTTSTTAARPIADTPTMSDSIQPRSSSRSTTVDTTVPDSKGATTNSDSSLQTETFMEKEYVFNNKNIGQRYMVKFFDENEDFLFSLTLPYGKTLKTYDENNQLHDEYSIRQDTSITLNTNDYINYGSTLIEYNTREVKVNSSQIIEIYPVLQKNIPNTYKKSAVEENNKSKLISTLIVFAASAVMLISIIIYLFIKRKKDKQEEQEEQDSI